MFVIHRQKDTGHVDYLGEVFSETETHVRIQAIDASLFVLGGMWELSDEIIEAPKSECRFFLTAEGASEACVRANKSIHGGVS
jgi:hypothetical protein